MVENKFDKAAAEKISDYINNNSVKTARKGDIIVNGKIIQETAHTLPRSLFRLNIANHRFSTAIETLREERKEKGGTPDFDMNDKSDVDEIREMLRGVNPSNSERKTQYKKLLQEIRERSIETGDNGLKSLTIVSADGVYINGNRRDTVLEDLTELENKKRQGGLPQKYEKIDVIICPDTITASDIRQMELKEQAGIDFRDEYDRMNTALLIKEEYDTQLEAKGPGKRDEVLNIIASKIPGKDKKHVEDYLKFLEFVDLVLEALDREKEYYKINTKTDNETDAKPVTTICIEYQHKWEKATAGSAKTDIIFHCAAFCQGVFNQAKNKPKDGEYKFSSRGKRILSSALTKKGAKSIMDNYDMSNFDFQSEEDLKDYGNMLDSVVEKAKHESWLEQPEKLLRSVENSLRSIDEALSTSESKKVKARLEHVHVKRSLKLYGEIIDRIDDKIKKIKD